MYPDLYLIRHGQSVWNREGRMQGRLDSPLTETGRGQARRLAPLVASIEGIWLSSPQGRAVETATILFGAGNFATDPRLAEIDVGEFSGRRIEESRRDHPEIFAGHRLAWYDRAPGGEHFAGLAARVSDFLHGLPGPAVIVTHGITLRMLRIVAMARPLCELGSLPVEQGRMHVIRAGRHQTWRPEGGQQGLAPGGAAG
ncbi:histidine phosphatase family protein [Paracoccus sp. (in: a-proteobacteria)]|nr:histidine phosphatase family protein [Paracoccus sp. (in: a-proteobacteria)]